MRSWHRVIWSALRIAVDEGDFARLHGALPHRRKVKKKSRCHHGDRVGKTAIVGSKRRPAGTRRAVSEKTAIVS
jgi:hypothetical protein